MIGRLNKEAFLSHDWVQNIATISMLLGGIFLIILLTYSKRWKWLWKEWLTSLDPKKIGVMYLIVTAIMLLKGFGDAIMMRLQQMLSVGDSSGYMSAFHFQEVFSAHGTTMVFFVGMGLIFGAMNLIVPLQIGARDVAFPFLNALSFWLFAAGASLIMISLAIGDFSAAGWLAYPPLSSIEYSPGEGVDYWIWLVQLAGVGSTLAGINFFVTILKMRCPGMTLMRMPLFTWSVLNSVVLIIFAFPVLTITLTMLTLDRYLGMHFFSASYGGNPMLYVNLIWAWGHPEVYILILPAFGIFSEVVATFSQKRLFGYTSMVFALIAITFLSFIVWLHHFFTMGAGPNVNAFFGIMTMLIAIPTGVKVFNWLFTMFRGRVKLTTPMLWFLGFIFNFTIGGMTGVLLSAPPVDYLVHNSLFLIAHFHGTLIGGLLFGFFAGFTYWFPKFSGFTLHEGLGKCAFWCWFVGFLIAFMPLYMLGLMGATRRLNHYDATTWHPFFVIVAIGAAIIGLGIFFQILEVVVSVLQRKKLRDTTGDPWHGRTLEWATSSPPEEYNFATLPEVNQIDAFWAIKEGRAPPLAHHLLEPLYLPKNSALPPIMGAFGLLFGFAMTWRMYPVAMIAFVGTLAPLFLRVFEKEEGHYKLLKPGE